MEPITLLLVAAQQALLGLIKLKANQDEVDPRDENVRIVLDIAAKVGQHTVVEALRDAGVKAATLPIEEVIDTATAALRIAQDVANDKRARKVLNDGLIKALREHAVTEQTWKCPRSGKRIVVGISGHSLSLACPSLMDKPPLACRISQKRLALAALSFPPLAPTIIIGKAFLDFTLLSLGRSPWKTYGYCAFADKIASLGQ